jgi:DNA-binding GntR family transcriptional regulator
MPIPAAATELTALDRTVLHERIAERLRDLIIDGSLAAGAHLNERVLCDQLQVSRTPLREAFRTLAGEGMIHLIPNRGAVVSSLGREDVDHAFELMASLEGLSGELAAQRATDSEIQAIRRLHQAMVQAHARRDLGRYYRINRDIHAALVRCTRNPLLADMHQRLNARLQALRFRSNLNPDKWDVAIAEHARMIELLEARDARALATLMRRHLKAKQAVVTAQLDAQAAPASKSAQASTSAPLSKSAPVAKPVPVPAPAAALAAAAVPSSRSAPR